MAFSKSWSKIKAQILSLSDVTRRLGDERLLTTK